MHFDPTADSRDEVALIEERTALTNQLQSALREYYPAALEASEDWTLPSAWAFVEAFPTPRALVSAAKPELASVARELRLPAFHKGFLRPRAVFYALWIPALTPKLGVEYTPSSTELFVELLVYAIHLRSFRKNGSFGCHTRKNRRQ